MEIIKNGDTVEEYTCDNCACVFELSEKERMDSAIPEDELSEWFTEDERILRDSCLWFSCPECRMPIMPLWNQKMNKKLKQ